MHIHHQDGYLDLAGFDVNATQPVVENIQKAATAAHEAGIQVIYFKNGWDDQYIEAGGWVHRIITNRML